MVCLPLFCVYTILLILNQNILNKILLALFLHYLTYVQLYSTSALQECSDTIAMHHRRSVVESEFRQAPCQFNFKLELCVTSKAQIQTH